MASPARRRGLPSDYKPAIDASLDHLTEVTQRAPKDVDDNDTPSGNSSNSVSHVPSVPSHLKQRTASTLPAPRRHVKVREDLYEQLRAGVWHARASGRPRMKLDELVDEIVAVWYEQAKAENGGADLEDYGPLR